MKILQNFVLDRPRSKSTKCINYELPFPHPSYSEVNLACFCRWQKHPTDFKNQVVEVFGDGSGRCGSKLCSCEGVPVYHPDKYTGEDKLSGLITLSQHMNRRHLEGIIHCKVYISDQDKVVSSAVNKLSWSFQDSQLLVKHFVSSCFWILAV